MLGTPADAIRLSPMPATALVPWTEMLYFATYPFVVAVPLLARTARSLRAFAHAGLFATVVVIPFYLLFPVAYDAVPVTGSGAFEQLMRWERLGDNAITALPAFHTIWAFLAARAWSDRWPRMRVLFHAFAALIATSCVTTGMHHVYDVVAAMAFLVIIVKRKLLWSRTLDVTEQVANSWREWRFGPVRIINHGVYAGIGAALGVATASIFAGAELFWWLIVVTFAAIAGAALWAQFVEGSPSLLRPYGYFGSIPGVLVAVLAAAANDVDTWRLVTAFTLGSTVTYSVGRLRCLVQGCCHGRETEPATGIRYTHPRSRVVRLSSLQGVPVYPTPLYSLLAMLATGLVMARLWMLAAPLSFVFGVYFLLVGLARFVEEHYRGEPQTAVYAGLRLYQWLALGMIVVGGILTTIRTAGAPPLSSIALLHLPALVLLAVVVTACYGLDFPSSNRRFSRLV
jgi:prolipoprotein diacylglyceryltransferase